MGTSFFLYLIVFPSLYATFRLLISGTYSPTSSWRSIALSSSTVKVRYAVIGFVIEAILNIWFLFRDNLENSEFDPFTNLNSPQDLILAQQILGKLPPLFGLAGWSGSGKTTLSTKLIGNFTKIGINVGTLKHAHHKFDIDKPGKDSYNLRKAGARPMVISSKERFALIQENDQNDEKSLFEMLEIFAKSPLNKCDIIIVEGSKNENIPKTLTSNSH